MLFESVLTFIIGGLGAAGASVLTYFFTMRKERATRAHERWLDRVKRLREFADRDRRNVVRVVALATDAFQHVTLQNEERQNDPRLWTIKVEAHVKTVQAWEGTVRLLADDQLVTTFLQFLDELRGSPTFVLDGNDSSGVAALRAAYLAFIERARAFRAATIDPLPADDTDERELEGGPAERPALPPGDDE